MGKQNFGDTSDQKKILNKMKHDLEGYRELILHMNSVLKWEKKFYPGLIFGLSTVLFLILWYLDLSTMTLVSLILLIASIVDIGFPVVSKLVFKPENWTGENEHNFEIVCGDICAAKASISNALGYMFASKEEKSPICVIITIVGLLLCCYIGAVIDNLLLSYLGFLFVMFYPGLLHHGIVNMVKEKVFSCVTSKIQCIKQKKGD